MTSQKLIFSKVDYCPVCNRKLCKRMEVNGVPHVEFRHKGARVVATDMSLVCLGCQHEFLIDADNGVIDEVLQSGR